LTWLIAKQQFIFRYEIGDAYLGAVSRFMSNAFEYGDALLPRPEGSDPDDDPPPLESNQPYINLATSVFHLIELFIRNSLVPS
jgi:hypothetical protein